MWKVRVTHQSDVSFVARAWQGIPIPSGPNGPVRTAPPRCVQLCTVLATLPPAPWSLRTHSKSSTCGELCTSRQSRAARAVVCSLCVLPYSVICMMSGGTRATAWAGARCHAPGRSLSRRVGCRAAGDGSVARGATSRVRHEREDAYFHLHDNPTQNAAKRRA